MNRYLKGITPCEEERLCGTTEHYLLRMFDHLCGSDGQHVSGTNSTPTGLNFNRPTTTHPTHGHIAQLCSSPMIDWLARWWGYHTTNTFHTPLYFQQENEIEWEVMLLHSLGQEFGRLHIRILLNFFTSDKEFYHLHRPIMTVNRSTRFANFNALILNPTRLNRLWRREF